jgi:hypothetical protein
VKNSNPAKPPSIRSVQIIFKTHLDLGFTDLARNVEKKYFSHFIPQAIDLARSLRERGGPERFVWTVGSYLIFEFLERATPAGRKAMEKAIAFGDIAWHAAPFTTHTELMDPPMFRYCLSLSQRLDKRFGKKTISAKMTDVTGHCRAIIPMLADIGVELFPFGCNPASNPPDVPAMFRWKHPGGSHLTVMYQSDYGGVAHIPGTSTAVMLAFTGDNHGPQSPDAVIQIFDDIRARFPGATPVAATLDDTARAVGPIAGKLPVIEREIGDGWMHGATTDPQKIAHYRELQRLRTEWLAEGKFKPADKVDTAFSRHLIMVPEHTWGMDEKTHLDDYENYRADQLAAHRKDANFIKFESSWKEQCEYIRKAVGALPAKLKTLAEAHLKSLKPRRPRTAGFSPLATLETKRWQIGFDPVTGAITRLTDKASTTPGGRISRCGRRAMRGFGYRCIFYSGDFGDVLYSAETVTVGEPTGLLSTSFRSGYQYFITRQSRSSSTGIDRSLVPFNSAGPLTHTPSPVQEEPVSASAKIPGFCRLPWVDLPRLCEMRRRNFGRRSPTRRIIARGCDEGVRR